MSDPGSRDKPEGADAEAGGFLSRWSRRKAEARQQEQAPAAEPPVAPEPEPEIDLAALPSIDSLTADSDFSLFLRKGVPPALKAAALRKLWLVEPSVVNYQALVEYNWDFTAPGYGDLLPGDDVVKMAQKVFSGFSQEPKPAEEAPVAVPPAESSEPQQALPAPDDAAVAVSAPLAPDPQPAAEPQEASMPRRRHGGALPT
ncbi:DUF3306 domain-containing protein [Ferrovibrio terrae]|uniref:DUF3306 domain-containing protein n=1 Tax=Ferrovibrio terrae TaxID=2594003 RepID=UPI0031381269